MTCHGHLTLAVTTLEENLFHPEWCSAKCNKLAHPWCFPLVFIGEVKFLLNVIQELLQTRFLLFPRVIRAQEDIRPPVGRVKAPMASPVLQRFVTVHYEFLGRVHEPAVHALDAGRVGTRVELRDQQTLTLPEAFVIDLEALLGELQLDGAVQLLLGVRRVRPPVDERVAQALRVRLGDESAGRRGERQDAHHLQDLQLVGGAARAVDV